MKPYLPVYSRPPNVLIRYQDERFVDKAGNGGINRLAIYKDSKGKQQSMTAQIIWDKEKNA